MSCEAPGEALGTVRRTRQRERQATVKGKRGHSATWNPRLYRARHLLLRGKERLSESQRQRLCDPFVHDPVIAEAWWLKEALRSVYAAESRAEAEWRLDRFAAPAARFGYQPFSAYLNGITPWREEILAYFDQPASNGYAEWVINNEPDQV
jgi:transposase